MGWRPAALTPREQEVAAAAAAGCSTREIADRLLISPRTVEHHLAAIYRKLGVSSRAALAIRFGPQVSESESGPATRYVSVGRHGVAYRVWGEGPLDLVVVVGPVSHVELLPEEPGFRTLVEGLSVMGRVVVLDRRGNGLSDEVPDAPPTVEDWVADLEAVLDELASQAVVLVGVSDGLRPCLSLASRSPGRVQAVVGVGGFAILRREARRRRTALLSRLRDQWGDGQTLAALNPEAAQDAAVLERLARVERFSAPPGRAAALLAGGLTDGLIAVLERVRIPTLLLHRRGDAAVPLDHARELAAMLPTARLELLEGTDHHPWFGDVANVTAQISAFLRGLVDRTPGEVTCLLYVDEAAEVVARQVDPDLMRTRVRVTAGGRTAALFDEPVDALLTATSLSGRSPGTRCVLHVGEVIHTAMGLTGPAVETALTVLAHGVAAPVIATSTFRDLVPGDGWGFEPLGTVDDGRSRQWQIVSVRGPTVPRSPPPEERR